MLGRLSLVVLLSALHFAWTARHHVLPPRIPKERFTGFLESDTLARTHFRRIGVTARHVEFAHLSYDFNLVTLHRQITAIRQDIGKQLSNSSDNHNAEFRLLQQRLDGYVERLMTITSSGLPEPMHRSPRTRVKRFVCGGACVLGLAVGFGLLGGVNLGLGVYSTVETNNLHHRLEEVEKAMDSEFISLESIVSGETSINNMILQSSQVAKSGIRREAMLFWFLSTLHMIEQRVNLIENTIRSALHHRLDPAVLQITRTKDIFNDIGHYAFKTHLTMVTKDPYDLLLLPASVASSRSGFTVFLHVPLIKPSSEMTIYQHIDLPMPIGDGIFLSLSSDHDVLVISADATLFRTTTSVELGNDCTKLGEFYACPRGNVARKNPHLARLDTNDHELCLWAMFKGNASLANTACAKTLTRPAPQAVQLSAREFITYGETSGNITCRKSGLSTNFKTSAFGHFILPPSCEASSELFELSSSDSGYTRQETAWAAATDMDANVTAFLEGIPTIELDQILTATRGTAKMLSKISFDDAKRHLKLAADFNHPLFDWHLPSFIPTFSTGTIALLLVIGHIAYSLWNKSSTPAPGTLINVTNSNSALTKDSAFPDPNAPQPPPPY